jgi:capsular exopolysaccharide synthesis family protein
LGDESLGAILWRGKWLVVLAVAVGVALAVLAAKTAAKVYEASATIQVNAAAAGGSSASPADVQLANQNLASTYATRITDRSFLSSIQAGIEGGRLTTSALTNRLSAHPVQNTSLFELKARGPSPDEARRLAGDVVNAFIAAIRSQAAASTGALQQQIQVQITKLNDQIARLQRLGANADEITALAGARSELVRQLAALTASQIAAANSVSLTAPPTAASTPVSPRPVLDVIAGVLVGLLVGFLLAWLRSRLDRGLHSAGEAEQLLDVPALATIPVRRKYSSEDPVLGEAYDMLRANLAFLSSGNGLRVITVSSFNPREGKSSTVEGLAHAAARSGLDALMIDGDVRTRSLSERLGYSNAPGLTNVMAGMTDAEDVTIQLAPGLSLLPAGPMPPNPPGLFSSEATRELLDSLRDRYSLVLVDSPPVAHLADASILASISDGVIVVARVGVTLRSDLPAAMAALRQVPTPVVGVVVLEQRQIDETYYPAASKGFRVASPARGHAPADTVDKF